MNARPGGRPDPESMVSALCRSHTQLMVTENGALLARMAAALSHELNTPFGALAGAVQTMGSALAKISRGEGFDAARAGELHRRLDGPVREAIRRIQEVIGRMQRFSNLYGAETGVVAVDALLRDVMGLLDPKLKLEHSVRLELDEGLAAECHPEQISAVVSAVLHRLMGMPEAAQSLTVHASRQDCWVAIVIEAPGLALTGEQLACLLDPGLETSRCAWNLYSARQILLAHGGDLSIGSSREHGTIITLRLPAAGRRQSGECPIDPRTEDLPNPAFG
ncbi:MAG: HAMP domain-containing histidine kinase [Bryobacteraceae bacterium]|nr:HAMP domain-containing histidine kinase [Bryobacteraceae bacterium]